MHNCAKFKINRMGSLGVILILSMNFSQKNQKNEFLFEKKFKRL